MKNIRIINRDAGSLEYTPTGQVMTNLGQPRLVVRYLLFRIRKVPGSNIDPESNYPD